MRVAGIFLIVLTAVSSVSAFGQPAVPAVPAALEPWREWVLFGQEFLACPVLNGRDARVESSRVCAWPGALEVEVDGAVARFEQRWTLYKEDWIPLPGDARYWPNPVSVDGTPHAAVLRGGQPMVRAAAGEHRVAGELAFETRPAAIPVPAETGLVELVVDGNAVPLPELERGQLWLGLRPDAAVAEDRLSVQVYRRLVDSIPLRLETRVQLDVAGQAREIELEGALLAGFVGEALTTELPAELEPDGTLRVQVRPGRWVTTLVAHRSDVTAPLVRPAAAAPWPADEVWSFQSNPALRVAVLEGAPAVDAERAGVPPEWRSLPSFAVGAAAAVTLAERSRNDALDDNTLELTRFAWLDFDGGGFTVQDNVRGELRSGWRLDLAPPYTMTMASIGGEHLLVTEGPQAGTQGVELRQTRLDLTATARLPALAVLPVTGYTQEFDSASTMLFLPPAHRLVAAPGADAAGGAWLEQWRLLDIFVALLVVVASWRLFGPLGGVIAAGTMLLVFQEPGAPRYAWLNLLLVTALVRAVPEGRARRWCVRYRFASAALLVVLLVPFAALQLRVVVFPQLEQPSLERSVADASPSAFSMGSSIANLRGLNTAFGTRTLTLTDGRRNAFGGAQPSAQQAPAAAGAETVVTGTRMRRDDFSAANATAVTTSEEMRALGVTSVAEMIEALPGALAPPGGPGLDGGLSRYRPGALVQTGPGLPDWAWSRYALRFDGPITPEQTYSIVILGPWLVGLWRVVGTALALAFAALLVVPAGRWPRGLRARARGGAAAAAVAAVALFAAPQPSRAQETDAFPPLQLLDELRARLTKPAPCHPACAEVTDARVAVRDDELRIELELAVLDDVAIPVVGATPGWRPETITVDGASRRTLLRDASGQAWLELETGIRTVVLAGTLAAADSLSLPFPSPPRRMAVDAPGWDVAGLTDGRLPSGALELVRQRDADDDGGEIRATAFPAFVEVVRTLGFGVDWTVATTVRRIAPREGAFTVDVALLPNEAVVTQGVEVEDGVAAVAFGAGQSAVSWQSRLPAAAALELTAGDGTSWSEVWRFAVGYEWHAEHDGVPAARALQSGDALVTEYLPRPGETLRVALTRPEPVSGDTIAVDDVLYTRSVGARATTATLELVYRSTRAEEHVLTLPEGSELERVAIEGSFVPLRLDGRALTLPIAPGRHGVAITWSESEGAGLRAVFTPVDLGAGATNVTMRLLLPGERWTLLTYGPTLGAAVLYWAELAVFIVAAAILGRIPLSPLRTHEWLLLGLGLSTFSWPVLFLFAVWAFLMSLRKRTQIGGPAHRFNAVQVVLALLTVTTAVALIGSVANGLLGAPNMHIVSPVGGSGLGWFMDRIDGVTPSAGAFSVSLWFYKAAMLAWALWLSFAALRWLRFAWDAFTAGGMWRPSAASGAASAG